MTIERALEIVERLMEVALALSSAAKKAKQAGDGHVDVLLIPKEDHIPNLLKAAGLTDKEVQDILRT